jgi:long-chain-fatty-acid---luciferin-component ligase
MAERHETLPLRKGSLLLFGGGWKLFTGKPITREQLTGMMSESFQLPAEMIVEGYSMSEMNAFTLRCEYGRFHIPPVIEPLILDETLNLMQGNDLRGSFAFLDPVALAYPGFIISGDEVRLVDGECQCGLTGPAVTEISRARAREIKGCGGIMASVTA